MTEEAKIKALFERYDENKNGVLDREEFFKVFKILLQEMGEYFPDKKNDVQKADFALLYFTTETAAECEAVLRAYETGADPTGAFTRGLAFRGVE